MDAEVWKEACYETLDRNALVLNGVPDSAEYQAAAEWLEFSARHSYPEEIFATGSDAGTAEGMSTEVDAISGATVTSKAVARSVSSAIAAVTGADAVSAATSWGG